MEPRQELAVRIDEFLRRIFHSHLRPRHRPEEMGLTLGQLDCLHAISRLEAPSMSDLSHELELPPSSVTGIVDKLVEAGKVRRESDADDRRVVRVVITEQGREDRDRHRRMRRQRLRELLESLEDDELRALGTALDILARAADRTSEDDGR